jgi:hypothetical protein
MLSGERNKRNKVDQKKELSKDVSSVAGGLSLIRDLGITNSVTELEIKRSSLL